MFEYMTVQEAAKKWGISERQVQKLCKQNRIKDVVHLSRVLIIPKNGEKPADARRKRSEEQ
ncbi:DNA binding domain-containing protein, excisionase family [Clostridium amylolyticum]|uniref:DNA binding domain-containing protein, excisionase family n=1 Tax=Clostridium amylolyticum TaxID=1121298 RepID=A0A1M6H8K0_9CLOT|nr:helix-turn-helix domain-containing protein [Clostridium amylolyticum]SHJ18485.1 DNA binding domain-containing protein, excisionase family [Clostridium amylolyticum]